MAAVMLALSGCGSLIVTQRSVGSLKGHHGFTWETHELEDFVIYVEPGSAPSRDTGEIGAEVRRARQRVQAYLQEPAYEPTVSVFVVDTRERMKDLIGRPSNAIAFYRSNSLCLVWSDTLRGGATHELLHVVATNLWGVPERWVNEGMAVDAAGPWRGHDPHAVCKKLLTRDELPSLREITRRFNRLPALAAYPAAGSFVRYLRETHGLETVHEVWDGGRDALPAATGMDLAPLEAAWLDVVEQTDAEGLDYSLRE